MEWVSNFLHEVLVWIEDLGYFGILIGLLIEVIPSEVVLAFGGYLVWKGDVSYWGAVLFGTLGAVGQNWILYAIGRYGGRPIVERFGKYIKIKSKHVDTAEKWFNKFGAGIVFTARFVPVMRQVISIPAGMARMNFGLFTLLTALASIPWSILFVYLGKSLGDQWQRIDEKASQYVQPAIWIALAIFVVYMLFKLLRTRGKTV
ncbi:DedA family protein [Paenibacillus sp. sgz302251]|uniref:DedA family protein n=1 Tax=Paenibacillus sp. sgz302251 TaxID=3414493 RepID=UPI003C7E8AF3